MSKRQHVVPGSRGWRVRREGGKRASSVHATQAEAIAAAKELGEVVVHGKNGKIRKESPYEGKPKGRS